MTLLPGRADEVYHNQMDKGLFLVVTAAWTAYLAYAEVETQNVYAGLMKSSIQEAPQADAWGMNVVVGMLTA